LACKSDRYVGWRLDDRRIDKMRQKPSIITNYCSMRIQKENLEFNNDYSRFINESELMHSKETPKEIRAKWEELMLDKINL